MEKGIINMLSEATSVKGQGVGSAYIEQVGLVKEGLKDKFDVYEGAKIKADINHVHTINPKFLWKKNKLKPGGHTVGYVHLLPETVDTSINIPKLARKIFYWYMIRFYKSMDYLVTVNPYFIGRLEHYGVPRERVTYIPNYVSDVNFHPVSAEEKAKIREKYGIDKDKFVVMSAGQLQVRKGIFDFIKIAESMPDVQFVWAGGFSFGAITDGYKEIERAMENPPANLKFLGIVERDEMNNIYNMADVMFLASFEELFPMTILESMSAHVPILLRDLEIYNDILFDFYLKENDIDGFIRTLGRLKNDKDFYQQGVEMARRGNDFYSKKHVLQMWDDFYTMVYTSRKDKK